MSVPRLRTLLATDPPEPDELDIATVLPVPYARVRAVASRGRRRAWLLTSGSSRCPVLAAGLGHVLTRPEPVPEPGDALPPVAAIESSNPVDVVWWADGTLHLAEARSRSATSSGWSRPGAGRRTSTRTVGWSPCPDGHRTLLGRPAPRSTLVSSPRLGLVAWTDASVPDEPRIVVWDVEEGERVAGVVTEARTRTITFDGGWLTFGTGLTDWAWDPHGGPARETGNGYAEEPGDRTALVDVVAGTRLEQNGYFLRVVRVGRQEPKLVAGFGGTLSADGRLVLTEANGRPRARAVRRADRCRAGLLVPRGVAGAVRDLRLRGPGRVAGRPGSRGAPDRHVQPRRMRRQRGARGPRHPVDRAGLHALAVAGAG